MIAKGYKFYMGLYSEIFRNLLGAKLWPPILVFVVGSYVLNQFPSIVKFGMKGFQVSAIGAIQGHHGSLVPFPTVFLKDLYYKHI